MSRAATHPDRTPSDQKDDCAHPRGAVWGKWRGLSRPYPLEAHLLDAAAMSLVLWENWVSPRLREVITQDLGQDAGRSIAFLAGVHDAGKASPVFQGQLLRSGKEPGVAENTALLAYDGYTFPSYGRALLEQPYLRRHEMVGAHHLATRILDRRESALDAWTSAAILGHHGSFALMRRPDATVHAEVNGGMWQRRRDNVEHVVSDALGCARGDLPARAPLRSLLLASGLVVLADRLASEGRQGETETSLGHGVAMLEACVPVGEEWMSERIAFYRSRLRQTIGVYTAPASDAILAGREPNAAQQALRQHHDALAFLSLGTGGGKTEASYLRHEAIGGRLLFLLPTIAAANGIHARMVKAFAGRHNVGSLNHHLARLEHVRACGVATRDGEEGVLPSEFTSTSADDRLLATLVTGTVDQLLRLGMPTRYAHLGLLAVANSHVVIDEAHMLDRYQMTLLDPVLRWCGATQTPVTVLSATLPTWQRQQITTSYLPANTSTPTRVDSGGSGVEHVCLTGQRNLVRLSENPRKITLQWAPTRDIVADAVTWAQTMRTTYPRSRILLILNRIDHAVAAARKLRGQAAPGENVYTLHSRMTAAHRRHTENEIAQLIGPPGPQGQGAGEGITLVGTQVLESSLDISADLLLIEACPAPGIVQRSGRLWRFECGTSNRVPGLTHPVVQILRDRSLPRPYFTSELDRTFSFLGSEEAGTKVLDLARTTQQWVDAAAFHEAEVHDPTERRAIEARIQAADLVATGLRDLLAKPEVSFAKLGMLTDFPDSLAPLHEQTRYLDPGAHSVKTILTCTKHGATPWAWKGDTSQIPDLRWSTDQDTIAQLMDASLPIPHHIATRHGTRVGGNGPLRDHYILTVPNTYDYGPDGLVAAETPGPRTTTDDPHTLEA